MTPGERQDLPHSPGPSAAEKAVALRDVLGPDYDVFVVDDCTVEIAHNSQRVCTVAFGRREPERTG